MNVPTSAPQYIPMGYEVNRNAMKPTNFSSNDGGSPGTPRRSPRLSSRACRGISVVLRPPRPARRSGPPLLSSLVGRACPESFSGLAQPAVLPLSPRRLPRFLVGALSACSGRFLSPLCHPEHACPDLSRFLHRDSEIGVEGSLPFPSPVSSPLEGEDYPSLARSEVFTTFGRT